VTTTAIRDPGADGTLVPPTRYRLGAGAARWYGAFLGWGSRWPIPRRLRRSLYGAYSRVTGAVLAEVEHDLADYATLADFFARRLAPGARPIDGARDAVVCPCDGVVGAVGDVVDGALIQAKGRSYRVSELLADQAAADRFAAGWYATIYLSPADYHRVHAPVAGSLVAVDRVPGALWPVKPFFTRNVEGLFARNERAILHLETSLGPVAVVMIAAVGVGHLAIPQAPPPGRRGERRRVELTTPVELARGDELGAFLLGSTVVIVFPAGTVVPDPLDAGQPVRFGQRIGTRSAFAQGQRR
jgi:phosphatidylserine decarboxylase